MSEVAQNSNRNEGLIVDIGGLSVQERLAQIESPYHIEDDVRKLLSQRPPLTTEKTSIPFHTRWISKFKFESKFDVGDVLNALQAEGYPRFPLGAGLYLIDAHTNWLGNNFLIAMEPVLNEEGHPVIFGVGQKYSGLRVLYAVRTDRHLTGISGILFPEKKV